LRWSSFFFGWPLPATSVDWYVIWLLNITKLKMALVSPFIIWSSITTISHLKLFTGFGKVSKIPTPMSIDFLLWDTCLQATSNPYHFRPVWSSSK
jgi:hypothetical protein